MNPVPCTGKKECTQIGTENLTAVLYGKDDMKLENREIPSPNDNQVLLRMECVGICGSDVHYWKEGKIGPYVVEKPMIIGHEGAGVVVKVGKSVEHLKNGDYVAIEPGYGCRMCDFCKGGRYNLCPKMIFCATPPVDGLLSQFYVHEADFCFKLPDNVSLAEGALMEPLSVGVHSCNRGQVKAGDKIAVMGCGPIGLACLVCAKAYGATKVVITDVIDTRLKVAKEMGADATIIIDSNENEESLIKKVTSALDGQPDVTFETTSSVLGVRSAVQFTKAGGNVVLIGMAETEMNMPLGDALFREVNIIGIFRYANTYPKAIDLVASGQIKAMPMVTHDFPMKQTLEAFRTAAEDKKNAIKVQIHPNPSWKPSK